MHEDTSIDPKAVAYYERLAHKWWDTGGPFWPLHRLNSMRIGYIRDQLCTHYQHDADAPRPLRGLRILDIGCEGQLLSEAAAMLGAHVLGIDATPGNIAVARLNARRSGTPVDYRVVTAELDTLLARGNLRTKGRRGVRVNPITKRFSMTAFLRTNSMVFCGQAGRHNRSRRRRQARLSGSHGSARIRGGYDALIARIRRDL